MFATRFAALCVLIVSLVGSSCRQGENKALSTSLDTTTVDSTTVEVDTSALAFNEDDRWLGLGVKQFGDLDSMIARRRIRALVPYTHLYFWIDGKERRGIAYEALNMFERSFNKKLGFDPPRIRIIFIPVNRSQVLPLLQDGYADLAYAGITITEERRKLVDFSEPTVTGLKEIVVGGSSAPPITRLADLSGKEIYLHKGSSYESTVKKLNDSLASRNIPPVIIKHMDPYLETEDMLELVNSGVIPFTATVEDAARLWANVMDSLVLYDKIPLAKDVSYGMVFRKNSPKLKSTVDQWVVKNAKGTAVGNTLYKRYVTNVKRLPNMHSKKTIAQVKSLRATFQKYADRYRLDWLLLVAQGYQESLLRQEAVSHVGAIGVMQVMPATAAGHPLFIKNINVIDNNVHAGVKYMRFLIDQYFDDPAISTLDQSLFALAAYNCGPGRVIKLRKKAKAKGLNPNVWFDNVEIIAAQEIL